MSATASTILGTLATLIGLWWLATLFARHLQGLVLLVTRRPQFASVAYDLLVLPGVVLHELAHILMAVLLRVRVVRVDLFRFRRADDPRLGEVIVERVDPLRMSLIGAGPLLAGIPIMLLLLRWLRVPPLGLSATVLQELRPLLAQPWSVPRLYLVWAVANTMFPSAADRAAWWIVGTAGAAIFVIAALTGFAPTIPPHVTRIFVARAAQLTSGLLPVVALDLLLVAAVVILETVASRATGRRLVRR